MLSINRLLCSKKTELLSYFRDRAKESLDDISRIFGSSQFKQQASEINKSIIDAKDTIIKAIFQKALKSKWSKNDLLRCILMVTYTNYIVMLEYRNYVWPYEYMAFSRRIGELWEPFCKLCFEFPIRNIAFIIPPLFSEVKKNFTDEITDYINTLNITKEQKNELIKYYNKVWSLVTSGEIKLELDLHFELSGVKFVIDFKSGFGSNEKGNTNRLLLVASIYKNLGENYKCVILVRSEEDRNNNYYQTLKNSIIWEAYCGDEAYAKINEYSGFNIKQWITDNIDWDNDFSAATMEHFRSNNLEQYLKW